jgi:hypothetical protein
MNVYVYVYVYYIYIYIYLFFTRHERSANRGLWGGSGLSQFPMCVCVCVCVCVSMVVHTCYVLIKPPIPYITFSRCKKKFILLYVLLKLNFMRELTQESPLVTSLKRSFCILKVITLFFDVLLKFYFMRELTLSPLPCENMGEIIIFFLHREGSPLVNSLDKKKYSM